MLITAGINIKTLEEIVSTLKAKGTEWFNITVKVGDKLDKIGNNVTIVASQTKEQREANQKEYHVGNGKTVYVKDTTYLTAKAIAEGLPVVSAPIINPVNNFGGIEELPF